MSEQLPGGIPPLPDEQLGIYYTGGIVGTPGADRKPVLGTGALCASCPWRGDMQGPAETIRATEVLGQNPFNRNVPYGHGVVLYDAAGRPSVPLIGTPGLARIIAEKLAGDMQPPSRLTPNRCCRLGYQVPYHSAAAAEILPPPDLLERQRAAVPGPGTSFYQLAADGSYQPVDTYQSKP